MPATPSNTAANVNEKTVSMPPEAIEPSPEQLQLASVMTAFDNWRKQKTYVSDLLYCMEILDLNFPCTLNFIRQ